MAGASVSISVEDAEFRAALAELGSALKNPKRALRDVGEYMLLSTDENFRRQSGPDGTAWPQLSDVTLMRRLMARSGTLSKRKTKTGGQTLTKKGMKLIANARILRDSGMLQDTIRYQLSADGQSVQIGTDRKYGATQQFGAKRGSFGYILAGTYHKADVFDQVAAADRVKMRGQAIPWGDIPPRPFLGIAQRDRDEVLAIFRRHLLAGF